MKFIAEIDVMPHKALLDPQGKAVTQSMQNLHLPEISGVRIGKHISLEVEAASKEEANQKVGKKPVRNYWPIQLWSILRLSWWRGSISSLSHCSYYTFQF